MRCVICHPATAELPGELLTSLSRRMSRMTICTDIFSALAECCFIQREHAARRASEGAPESGVPTIAAVLVLVHPRHIPDNGGVRLVEATRNYAPAVAVWRYDRGANPKLRAVVEQDVVSAFAPQSADVPLSPPSSGAPAARSAPLSTPVVQTRPLADVAPKHTNGTHHAPAATPTLQRAPRAASLLTEEELRMLLSSDPLDSIPLPNRPTRRTPSNGGGS